MTVKEFVDDVLCVPVTRIGNKYIVEAIELVIDTKEHKFYSRLSEIHKVTPQYLEKAMRDAKNLSLLYMGDGLKKTIFHKDSGVTVNEYIIIAAEYYRRVYENKA